MFPIIPLHVSLRQASLKPSPGRCTPAVGPLSAATATATATAPAPAAPLAAASFTAPAPAPADAAGREVGGAVARRTLPPLARTQPFSARELVQAAASRFPAAVAVRVDAAGMVEAAGLPPAAVAAAARLAPDCQAANALLVLGAAGADDQRLAVHTLRAVAPHQHLLLWFSEQLLATLHIPFLSPGNIQANARYQCVECGADFESPNPLKLHLALSCGKLPARALWDRLLASPHKLHSPQAAGSASGRTSAFRPYERRASASESVGSGSSPGVGSGSEVLELPVVGGLVSSQGRSPLAEAAEERLHQHVEAVATSLGRATAAPGHLCVYCGKLYSRKYGLKIHIRTHTGYKPLKCKVCLRAFGDPSNLNKHVRLHAEGQTPYRCDLCGKVLVRRRDLERHLKSRHCTWSRHDTSCDEVTQRTHLRVAELC